MCYLSTLILVVCAAVSWSCVNAQSPVPVMYIQTAGADLSTPTQMPLTGNAMTSNIGANWTIGCYYVPGDQLTWSVVIGKWSIVQSGQTTPRAFMPMIVDRALEPGFLNLLTQYTDLDARIDNKAAYYIQGKTMVIYLLLSNFQVQDAGDYGCFASAGVASRSSTVNITLNTATDLYGVELVSPIQQQVVDNTFSTQQFACTVYHTSGVEKYSLWFDQCNYVANGAILTTPTCNGPAPWNSANANTAQMLTQPAIGTVASAMSTVQANVIYYQPQVTTGGGMASQNVFWTKVQMKHVYTLTVATAINKGWLNKTLGCFAYKNETSTLMRDYMTFLPPGVDFHLDPTTFSCTPSTHNAVLPQGQLANFSCVIQKPTYRVPGRIYWEVTQNVRPGNPPAKPLQLQSQQDVTTSLLTKQIVAFGAPTSTSLQLTETRITTSISVLVDAATTVNWKFALVVEYDSASRTYRSGTFLISLPGAQAGAIGANKATLVSVSPFLLFATVFALIARA
jgi:hypothetical protein